MTDAFPADGNPWVRGEGTEHDHAMAVVAQARAGVPDRLFDVAFDAVNQRGNGLTDRDMCVAGYALAAVLADLREQVAALPTAGGVTMPYVKGAEHRYETVNRDDVLDLLDWGRLR